MTTLMQFTAGALLASAFALTLSDEANAQTVTTGVKNVVLVHGAFADGSSWAKVIPLLQDKGYNVIAVQNPLTSLEDDVAATKRAIAAMDGPVLLVAHSYGGMVITEAGVDPKVAGLLYVSALIPEAGQSVEDVVKQFPPAAASAEFRADPTGFLSLSPKGIDECFVQDLPADKRKVIFATQVQWAGKATMQKITNVAWRTKPSWVMVAAQDKTINPDLQRAEAKKINATTTVIEAGHVPMLSQPKKVTNFIVQAAQSLSVQQLAQKN